mmetsp:Transcript_31715/g.73585  ORF Transcript_31715/g.73585 Transcript_31715/m.73585 type:complete len:352 (-) Transcript_31715:28-1083(-)
MASNRWMSSIKLATWQGLRGRASALRFRACAGSQSICSLLGRPASNLRGTRSSMLAMSRLWNDALMSSIDAGRIRKASGRSWCIRDRSAHSAPHMTFVIRGLSIIHLTLATQDWLRMSISSPNVEGRPDGAEFVRTTPSTALVSWNWTVTSSPPWPDISPLKSTISATQLASHPVMYALTRLRRCLNSVKDGVRTEATSALSDMTRKGQPSELLTTKASIEGMKLASPSRENFTPVLNLSLDLAVEQSPLRSIGVSAGETSSKACPVVLSERQARSVTTTFDALNLPRHLPSSSAVYVTLSPGDRLARLTSAERCTKTSFPPPSGNTKPNPLSSTHFLTVPMGMAPPPGKG